MDIDEYELSLLGAARALAVLILIVRGHRRVLVT